MLAGLASSHIENDARSQDFGFLTPQPLFSLQGCSAFLSACCYIVCVGKIVVSAEIMHLSPLFSILHSLYGETKHSHSAGMQRPLWVKRLV